MSPWLSRIGRKNIPLAGSSRETGGRADTLDIPDHRRHLGKVGQPDKFGHQGNSRSRGRSHGAGAGPACSDRHSKSGKLIFRLHNGKRRFPGLRVDPILLHVIDHLLDQRTRRSDRIPGHDRASAKHGAQSGGGIALDNDFALSLVHPLDTKRIGLHEIRARVFDAEPSPP